MIESGFERREPNLGAVAPSVSQRMRVYELAKELAVPHKDLLGKIRALGMEVANHMSFLAGVDVDRIKRALDRARHETLFEERLNDTVIRRRSRTAPAAPVAKAPEPAAAAAPAPVVPPPVVEVIPAPVAAAPPVRVPRRGITVVRHFDAPRSEPEPVAQPEVAQAPPPHVVSAQPVVAAPVPAMVPAMVLPEPFATASPNPAEPTRASGPIFKQIPQTVVTGSAATGAFIQLPGMGPKGEPGVPKIEIKDRDEELRRMGRAGLLARQPVNRDRFGRGGAPMQPGQRPGGPPKKRVAAAGKKLKQTQITTPAEHKRVIKMAETIPVAELAQRMGVKGGEVVKKLWALGMMGVNINHNVDHDTASLIAAEFGYQIESTTVNEEEIIGEAAAADAPEDLVARAPVITVMGHVDHGKTSLLDSIRKANVAGGEAGGITQHIGAYRVRTSHGDVVFLDTPGHEAFTAMRARGAKMTDIVVLVVAADDGPMPQTIEAINHAKAAGVPIMVAINKIDKPGANPAQIRQRLMEHGLVSEDLGGDTIFVEVSAKTRQGVDKLLEMLALQADVLELKANPNKPARGHVVEARLDRARGSIATVLVQEGTLRVGDLLVAGEMSGKIRAMLGDKGQNITEALPATPVEVLGLDGVSDAGETFNVVADEKAAKTLVEHRRELRKKKEVRATTSGRVSLENILERIKEGAVREVKIVLKADVQGSCEAIANALRGLSTEKVGVNVISTGVGGITESDITLAKASSAIVIGFNVRPAGKSSQLAEQEGVDIKLYQVIYDAIDDVKKAMLGMLEPVTREKVIGKVSVRQIFNIAKVGTVCGCSVTDGKVTRKSQVRLVRDSVVVFTGRLASLKRFKEDVGEVSQGYECGLSIEGYNDIKENDVIEAFELETLAATLDAPLTAAAKK